jgi:hypothetical protein
MPTATPPTLRVVHFDIRSMPQKPPAPSVRRRVKAPNSIKHVVRVAAGKEIPAAPFPVKGQQPNFRREMAAILPGLPTT